MRRCFAVEYNNISPVFNRTVGREREILLVFIFPGKTLEFLRGLPSHDIFIYPNPPYENKETLRLPHPDRSALT